MINKNNICVIIGSYPTTYLDNSLLGLTIESWKQQGYNICLVSHSPLNSDLQKAVKYYIYTDENEILKFDKISDVIWYYGCEEFLYQSNWGNTLGEHSFTILKNIQNALHFLKSKNYTHFIYAEVDSFLIEEEHQLLSDILNKKSFTNKRSWFMTEATTPSLLPATNLFGGDINYFFDKLNFLQTPQDYIDNCGNGYSLESLFGRIFFPGELNNQDILITQQPREIFTNPWFGSSSLGTINIPGLKHKDWMIDIVRDGNGNEHFYLIVSPSKHSFETKIKLFKDNKLVTEFDHTTGGFLWIRLDVNETKDWKVENWIKNEKVKEINYSTEEIKNNIYSFLSLVN